MVPVLVVVTVVVLWDAFRGTGDDGAAEEQSMVDAGEIVAEAPRADGLFPADLASGTLPDGGPFTERGAQRWRVLPGTTARVGSEAARTFTYTVEVEDGIDTAGYGGDDAFGLLVDQTLADPRSWVGDPQFAFRRIDVGTPDFRISLTSQMTIREGCGYDIRLEGSCFNPSLGRVLLNEARWVRGTAPAQQGLETDDRIAFQGDLGSYRQYLVNHEVGHAIGFAQHERCGVQDGLAPIMMQQTFGTNNDDIARLEAYMDELRRAGDSCGARLTVTARQVPVLMIRGANPVFTLPASLGFAAALAKVTVPAKLSRKPRRTHSAANSASPEKQWNTTFSGRSGASSRIRTTSSWASRSWICTALPRRWARSRCQRNASCCEPTPSGPVR